MASVLQQQLRSIAVAAGLQGNDTRDQRSSQKQGASQYIRFPSILYTEAVASDIHIDELYNQALAAYSQLVRLDPRFAQTRKALFSPPSAALRIHAADAEQRAALDGRVDVFCRLLQPYFITEYAQHALEYLIRMFHVHEHNVESLMKCGLAHHVCVEFSRLVRICRVEGTVFEFLGGVGKKGGGDTLPRVSREVLVSRMGVDRALWRFVCDMAKEASVGEWKVVGGGNGGGGVLMGWYAAVTCEVIGGMAAVDEEVVGFLLPYVVAGLRGGVVGGYRDATCMVVGGLSGSVVMRRELVDGTCRVDIHASRRLGSLGSLGSLGLSWDVNLIRCLFERVAYSVRDELF